MKNDLIAIVLTRYHALQIRRKFVCTRKKLIKNQAAASRRLQLTIGVEYTHTHGKNLNSSKHTHTTVSWEYDKSSYSRIFAAPWPRSAQMLHVQ